MLKKLLQKFKWLFSPAPQDWLVRECDWIVPERWEDWPLTRVEIPLEIHRWRVPKFIKLVNFEGRAIIEPLKFKLAYDYSNDGKDTLVIKYERSNYPSEPRQEFTIQF